MNASSQALHIREIQQNGYTVIKNVNNAEVTRKLLTTVLEIREKRWSIAKEKGYPTRKNGCVFGLQNESLFLVRTIFSHPITTPIVTKLLNDSWYKTIPSDRPNFISRNGIRAQSSGKDGLFMHIDSFIPGTGKRPWLLQVFMVLEDQDESNGTTLVVPNSHLSDEYATPDSLKDAIPLCPKAGDVIIWDGRLWHGTTPNPEEKSRLVLASGFSCWFIKPKFDLPSALPDSIYQQLTDDEKVIMGFASPTFSDEFDPRFTEDTHNARAGYDVFPQHAPSFYKKQKKFANA